MPLDAVLYTRVSTQEQAKDRNGLEGQLASLLAFCHREGINPILHLEEVASGGVGLEGRPVLARAFTLAAKVKGLVLVSKLDRLSREVSLISTLMTQRVRFATAEDGLEVDPFMLHLKASFAEKERKMIGERTRAALAAKKARGEPVGRAAWANPEVSSRRAVEASTRAVKATADAFASQVAPMVRALAASGLTYQQIADRLNASGTPSARGARWHAPSVCRVLAR